MASLGNLGVCFSVGFLVFFFVWKASIGKLVFLICVLCHFGTLVCLWDPFPIGVQWFTVTALSLSRLGPFQFHSCCPCPFRVDFRECFALGRAPPLWAIMRCLVQFIFNCSNTIDVWLFCTKTGG